MDIRNWARSSFEKLIEKKTLIFISTLVGLVAFRIWLILGVPKMYILGPHDDLFFAKAAHYLIHGEWMGPYTQMTLIKTPFYAFFLAASSLMGLPLLLIETLYYVAACLILYVALSPLIPSRSWRLFIFAVVLYIPENLAYLRVYRDGVYFSTTLYVVAFAIGFFLRLDRKIPELLTWSIGLGLSMGAFMIIREEGIWIYPLLSLVLLICIVVIWKENGIAKSKRIALVFLPIILWYIPSTMVSYINYSYYGFWGTNEQLEPEFRRVIDTLGRIKSDTWHPLISISEDARRKAYEASPMFNELKDSFEEFQAVWNSSENETIAHKPAWLLEYYGNGKSAISNDYFVWMMRDVMYKDGYYSGGRYPKEYYTRLADELEAACDNGKLECSPSQKIPLIGSIDLGHLPIIRRMFFENILRLVDHDISGIPSLDVRTWAGRTSNIGSYKYFEEIAYNPLADLGIPYSRDAQYLVGGKPDSRLRLLEIKEMAMLAIDNLYEGITPFLMAAVIIASGYLLINFPHIKLQTRWIVVSLFAVGLFVTRLLTLTIVDATAAVPGIYYGESIYIFLYIFSLLVTYWAVQRVISRGA